MMSGKPPETPRLTGACYNTVAPGYAFSLSGVYQPKDGQFAEVEGATSPVNAPREVRAARGGERGKLVQDDHGGHLWLDRQHIR